MNKAKFQLDSTYAAYEAVQRFKALSGKKFATQNKVRQMRNQNLQRAKSDAELIQLEEFLR